jgi:hypothetical protein
MVASVLGSMKYLESKSPRKPGTMADSVEHIRQVFL